MRLKTEIEYRGKMSNVDSYMNLILVNAEEFDGADVLANYGKVVIRGNNVLFIKLEREFSHDNYWNCICCGRSDL